MAWYRCGGGKQYSEENPRVSFTPNATASNITWVGSLGCNGSVDLVNTDTHLKIIIPYYNAWTCTVTIDDEQVDKFSISEATTKIYEFSNKTKATVSLWDNTSGDRDIQITCTVW